MEYHTDENLGVVPLVAIGAGAALAAGGASLFATREESGDESGRKESVVMHYAAIARYAFDSGRFAKSGPLATSMDSMLKRSRSLLRAYFDAVATGTYQPWQPPGNRLVDRLASSTGYSTQFVRDWLYMLSDAVSSGIVPAYVMRPAQAPVKRPLLDISPQKSLTTVAITATAGLVGYGLLRQWLFSPRR